ncbi:ABC transporter permease [Psychrosphaera haliotis]|uniref:FtsX-like permease family protein n=1 Tax=Psychrosphaera haliotis TaxID=555083 RepID=A0A6N8F7U1_9GAMM|nr:FtsX-like permease family protein [Psychrosphaera haliotis]MUH72635.1 FtsX-like permease family protein [Psychrosphaera haliotis]
MKPVNYFLFSGLKKLFNQKRFTLPILLSLSITIGLLIGALVIANNNALKPLSGVSKAQNISSVVIDLNMTDTLSFETMTSRADFGQFMRHFDAREQAFVFEKQQSLPQFNGESLDSYVFKAHFAALDIMGTKTIKGSALNERNFESGVWISESLYEKQRQAGNDLLGKTITIGPSAQLVVGIIEDIALPRKLTLASTDTSSNIVNLAVPQVWIFEDFSKIPDSSTDGQMASELSYLYIDTTKVTIPNREDFFKWYLTTVDDSQKMMYEVFLKKPDSNLELSAYREDVMPGAKKMSLFLLLSASLLALIAIVNVTNLFNAYYTARFNEFSVRLIHGARKSVLRRQLMLENTPLMVFSILLAVIIANLFIAFLPLLSLTSLSRNGTMEIDALAITAIIAITLLAFYIGIYLSLSRIKEKALQGYIQSSGKGVSMDYQNPLTKTLVSTQLALTIVFSFAGLAIAYKNYNIAFSDMGYQVEHIHNLELKTDDSDWADSFNKEEQAFYGSDAHQLTSSIVEVIEQSALKVSVISQDYGVLANIYKFYTQLVTKEDGSTQMLSYSPLHLQPGYLEQAGINIIAGKSITTEQYQQNEKVAVVTKNLADAVYPKLSYADIIGKPVNKDSSSIIIGIAENFRRHPSSMSRESAYIFRPDIHITDTLRFTLKTQNGAELNDLLESDLLLSKIQVRHPQIKSLSFKSYQDHVNAATMQQRIIFYTSLILVTFTLLLAVVGISGLTILTTKQKSYELAIRMTQGATRLDLVSLMLKRAVIMLVAGVAVGSVITLWVYDYINLNFNAELPAFNWVALMALILMSSVIYLLSVMLPTWNIVAQNPLSALRRD